MRIAVVINQPIQRSKERGCFLISQIKLHVVWRGASYDAAGAN
jgi:hypothetical protein